MELIISLVLAFGITVYAIPVIIYVAEAKKLFDIPDARKIHKKPIPALGGLGIFAGFMMAVLVTIPFHDGFMSFQYIVAACLIIFFVGVKDDIQIITPVKKFLGQLLAACILVFKGGFLIENMHGILGIYALPPTISYCLTVFTIVVIVNAFNLIDGVDGLAGSLGVLIMLCLGTYFTINKDIEYACLAFSMMGALLAFLVFNFQPARIFMGDTGSLMLGLIASVLIIHFVAQAPTAPVLAFQSAPVVAFAILFVPLFDTLRVFGIRILKGRSPFSPDRNHIHHILLDKGLSHRMVTLTLVFANIIMILIGSLGSVMNVNLLLGSVMMLGTLTITLLGMAKSKTRLHSVSFNDATLADTEEAKIRMMKFDTSTAAKNN
jgi:UDP-GlcNAc:undecaprenyl-phosphate/decaprenyl-phosphate GlcNAc-1-phosphate transferase